MQKFFKKNLYALILFSTTSIALGYYSWDINSWRFSYVGDDWPFYLYARAIVLHHFLVNPFDFNGVFQQNSLLSSVYQALFLQLFGFSNFAWRLSNIVLIIPITIFCYLWIKNLFDKQTALFSVLFLQCSFFLANFLKIGKNMPQALALFFVCLYFATRCVHKPSQKNFFFLGVFLGISFYLYIGPLFPALIWPFLLPLFAKKNKSLLLKSGFSLLLGYLLLLLPSLFSLAAWAGPAEKTLLQREYEGYTQLFLNILYNFSLFYHNFDYLPNHFVTGPAFDVITRSLILLGTIRTILLHRIRPYGLLMLSYISACVVIGVTSPYEYAPTTRSLFLLPFGAVFAGIALNWIVLSLREKRGNLTFPKHLLYSSIVFLFLLIFVVNVAHSQIGVFKESGHTGTALFMRELHKAKATNNTQAQILLMSDKQRYYAHLFFPAFREAYDLSTVRFSFLRTKNLTCAKIANAHVFILKQDKKAQQTYRKLSCPETTHHLTILSPTMPF